MICFLLKEKRRSNMELTKPRANILDVDRTKIKVFKLLTQCIKDIDNTVKTSGLTMHDVGIRVEKYVTGEDKYIIELKLQM